MPTISAPPTTNLDSKKPLSPGNWEGDFWVQEDGYRVHRKWVEKYPACYGPARKDPDDGTGEIEVDDVVSQIFAKFTGYGGTFSNWTERHAFIIFGGIGYNDVQSSEDVPPIPDFFLTEMAYCYTGLSLGRATKKLEDAASKTNWTPIIIAAVGSMTAGTVYGQQIMTLLLGFVK